MRDARAKRSSESATSLWRALALAAAAHGGVIGLASRAPAVERLVARTLERTVAIDLQVESVPETIVVIGPTDATSRRAGTEPRVESRPGRGGGRAGPSETPAAREPRGAPRGPPGDDYDALPGPVAALPGIGGAPLWSVPGAVPPVRAPPAPTTIAKRPIDLDAGGRAVRSTLDARDQKRGLLLPAANEAAAAIEAVVMSGTSPGESRATFRVDLDASGRVISIDLASMNQGDVATWRKVVEAARAALAGRRLGMRGDAATVGARVMIEVRTRERLPTGSLEGGGSLENVGAHKTRTVSSRATVIVPGAKALPEDIKPIVVQPFFSPPAPHESGVVPLNPGDAFRRRMGDVGP